MNRVELKNRLFHHRCMNCGFLGAVARRDSSRALADIGEVTEEHRGQWRHRLHRAREMRKLDRSEYDPVQHHDLGIDTWTPFGVMCGLGRPDGPQTNFQVRGARQTQDEFVKHLQEGFIVREPDPSSRSLFRRTIAVAQTFVWSVARPHSCPAYMRYRAGLKPSDHVATREVTRRWKRDVLVGFAGIILGALLTRLLGG